MLSNQSTRAHLLTLVPLVGIVFAWVFIRPVQVVDATGMQHEPLTVVNGHVFVDVGDDIDEVADIAGYCLSCHDGGIGPARQPANAAAIGSQSGCSSLPGVHPVGIRYPTTRPGFADPVTLPSGMLMVDGRISCGSCHDLADENHDLVVSTSGSELCLSCHRK